MKPTTTAPPPANAPHAARMNETANLKAAVTPPQGTSRPNGAKRTCPQCGATESWGNASWCPKCGFYPKLGTKVSAAALQPVGGETEELPPAGPLPLWIKVLPCGMLAILAVSIAARMRVPEDGPRTIWSLSQLGLGAVLLIASHVQAFIVSGSRANGLTMMDLVLSPLAVWKPVFHRLPGTGMLVSRGVWGGATALCAVLVTGGLGWDNLNQLFTPQSQKDRLNPFQAAMLLAGQRQADAEGTEDIDKAMKDFVEEIGAEGLAIGQGAGKPEPEMKSQCAIVGFTRDIKGGLHSVLLATMVAGKPEEFVAKLPVDQLDPAIRAKLEAQLPGLLSRRAYVRCPVRAQWVKPELTCMIGYDRGEAAEKWKNLEFLEIIDPNQPEVEGDEALPPGVEQLPPEVENALPKLQDALSR
jgi:hypothetical protein